MRLLCVAILLAAAACGPFGGAPGPTSANRAAGAVTSRPTAGLAGAGPAGVLLQLASPSTYSVSLVLASGRVLGPVAARLRTLQPPAADVPAALPVVSASDSRVYYLDGDSQVRFLGLDGSRGSAARVPGGPRSESGFAVSPDDRRIAVSTLDASADPALMRLSVQDLAGGGRVDLPTPAGGYLWPIGWHGGDLVVAVSSAPVQNVAPNPYGTFAGYELLDPSSGARLGSIDCEPAGILTPAGTACVGRGEALAVQDFTGRTHAASAAPAAVLGAAEAPNGGRVAFCCAAGQLQLWDVNGATVSGLATSDQAYGWIDDSHLLVLDPTGQRAQILDTAAGGAITLQAAGTVVAHLPGDM